MKKLKSLSIILLSFAVFSTVLFTAGNQTQAASKPQMITKGQSIQSLTPVRTLRCGLIESKISLIFDRKKL
ncbi:hypothetical protein [Terribacillus saccharophilus]|uniref:Uncharacterized protein n=1 Tax=Terribacillus saccharophilus TaxID=361277 RepID=A0ABX4GUL4_9BACI|nr:hypothetical protein [Terribacillus saccharophilus]PAD34223.1 hypothetical protein CHH56_15595 [Terribacillus saccharophilus]PAD94800.1 hypothetical protein CHH50_16685 [Terribacillus saccharophilus]PAD98549.1 hypothetical protein CHH48_16695 [Terribacillus saccharophilus]